MSQSTAQGVGGVASRQDEQKTEATQEAATAKPERKIETVAVESKSIKAYEAFSGVLESRQTHEIKADFETWTDLVVEEVIEQGSAVSQGTTLIKFKTETLDKAITEADFAFKNAQFDLQRAELEMKLANETFELDKAETERTWKEAQDEYKYYLDVRLPMRMDDLEYGRKSASYSLEYTKDELDQLEKMYLEDEITEESEAIVLKRAQRSVESAERNFKRNRVNLDRDETIEIPREKVAREVALKRAEHAYQRGMIALPISKEKAEIGLAQAKFALDEKEKKRNELNADLEKMEIKAVANGIVYYGQCVSGKWSGRKLEADQKIVQDSVVITVVDTSTQMVRASLDEAKLDNLTPKMQGKAVVVAAGNKPFSVTINAIAKIPGDDGKYDCEMKIDDLPGESNLMPGMGCKLSFLIADRDSLMTKKASVFSDDDGITHFVYLVDGDSARRTEVVVGKTIGDEIEIQNGLAAGDLISKTRQ